MEGLGINLPLLIAFVVNFLILFGLLTLVLYRPVLRVLDERQAKIKESIEQAERIKEQTARSEEEIKAHLETARKEGQTVIAQATQIGERLKEEAKEKARQEAETILAKAQTEIRQERDKIIDDLRKEFVDIAILAAEKVTRETLDKGKHRKLIDEVLKESATFKRK
ncbi:MAG: F0F1 ATP synthase subunit B [Chloroflexi bacterium]|nr:F0F1 ATP synthase subunit B [Chloroflexota bacterium]MBM3173747.1 F0F1 ATP synthase subunit B [Chloroflexota bacterium]MBM3174170.1 F0F1 ATP synthase subunit B [Chloroflexota bacterium]MBM4449238.1 F0F1 ATP synthase subunit B [Chloroflexota bacterium]